MKLQILILALVLLNPPFPAVAVPPQVGPPGSWQLTFNDEFDGTILAPSKWNPTGWVDNPNELQSYRPENVEVSGGTLKLWARQESYNGKNYTSGKVTTQNKFWQKYGYFEASMKLPRTQNMWPAFWLLIHPWNTEAESWPPEVDIQENFAMSGGPCYSSAAGVQLGENYPLSGGAWVGKDDVGIGVSTDLTEGFHTFGYEWSETNNVFYVDDVEVGETSAHPLTLYPMWVLLQMAISAEPVGTLPSALEIDYVRVYQIGTDATPAISITSPSESASFAAPATIPLAATATSATGGIALVEFYCGLTRLGDATNAPYAFTWTNVPMGDYALTARATDGIGNMATSLVVNVAVVGPLSQISVTPTNVTVVPGGVRQFTATGADQLGHAVNPQPTISWSVSGGGTMSETGLFTAGSSAGGPFNVMASYGGITGTVTVTVAALPAGTIGNTNEGTLTDLIWDNGAWINASRFQAAKDGTVTSLFAKVGAISGKYNCAIYTDLSGQPNQLLCSAAEVGSSGSGWQPFPLTPSVVVTNGQYCWLAIWSDDANARVYYSDDNGTLRWGRYDYGTWPDPISTSGGSSINYCIYAANTTPPLAVTAINLPSAKVGAAYSAQLTADGGSPPYYWGMAPNAVVPAGLTLSTNGVLSGVPSSAGLFSFPVVVTDSLALVASNDLALAVIPVLYFDTSPAGLYWTNNGLCLTITDLLGGGPVTVYVSTNLIDWEALLTNPPVTGTFQFIDTKATNWIAPPAQNSEMRLYRAAEQW